MKSLFYNQLEKIGIKVCRAYTGRNILYQSLPIYSEENNFCSILVIVKVNFKLSHVDISLQIGYR